MVQLEGFWRACSNKLLKFKNLKIHVAISSVHHPDTAPGGAGEIQQAVCASEGSYEPKNCAERGLTMFHVS